MNRILCIVGSMDAGGAETFLMKIYRNLNKEKYQFDFCVAKKDKNFYEDEIAKLGGKIFRITPKSKGIVKNFLEIKKIVSSHNYNCVLRVSQHSLSSMELLAAKLGGASKLALRSSNSNSGGNLINLLIHYLFRPISNRIVNIKIAPSLLAAKFMFGSKELKKNNVTIINNGLDFDKYKYDNNKKKKIREELKLSDKYVVGHVGRFNFQKNHKFLLDIFKEIVKKRKNSILLLIGKGELENQIIEYSKKLNIYDNIKFLGIRDDVSDIYSAMDVFVFPSLFEGMPNTIIEAQAAGLHCFISDTITEECDITGFVKFLSIKESPKKWCDIILSSNCNHYNSRKKFEEKNYNINNISTKFISLFMEELV